MILKQSETSFCSSAFAAELQHIPFQKFPYDWGNQQKITVVCTVYKKTKNLIKIWTVGWCHLDNRACSADSESLKQHVLFLAVIFGITQSRHYCL